MPHDQPTEDAHLPDADVRPTSDMAAELAYPRLDQILRGIFRLSSEGIIITDAQLRVLMFSEGAEAIFGYRHDEMLGRSIEQLIPERFHAAHGRNVDRFAAAEPTSLVMGARSEVVGRRKSGDEFFAEASISKLRTEDGLFFTVILRDTTERRDARLAMAEALRTAEAANEAKSAFLATMSHEIRTPLNGILGMAQAMDSEQLTPRQREQLDVIRQSGETLLDILNDVLDLAKIEAGKMELETIEFDLETLVNTAQAAFSALANRKGLSFAVALDGAAGRYRGDPTRIRQILYNLISNALKFTEAGEVRVTAAYDGARLRISVADTGVGIAPEAAARLFEPYVQADSSTMRRHGGTGLGLAICRQLAELMGGTMSVQSTPGHGAVFTLEAPLERVGAARCGGRGPETATEAPGLRPLPALRILAAEDNATNRLVLKTILQQLGLDLVLVNDGQAALEAWRAGDFDLILMDVQMPRLSGPEATRRIRHEEQATGRTPVHIVALTANAMAHQLADYRAAGMDAVLTKPIEVPKLVALLQQRLAELVVA